MDFLELPAEIHLEIADHLSQEGIYALIHVNRYFHSLLVNYLLKHNIQHREATALVWAVDRKDRIRAKKLVELGADINRLYCFRDGELVSIGEEPMPLHYRAARSSDATGVKMLLELGPDPERRDMAGRSPLRNALQDENKEIIQELSSRI